MPLTDASMPQADASLGSPPKPSQVQILTAVQGGASVLFTVTEPAYQRQQPGQRSPDPPPRLVASGEIELDPRGATELLLAGDAAASKPVAFDDLLILEIWSPGASHADSRYYFGPESALTYVPDGQRVPQGLLPSIRGFSLEPALLSDLPAGYHPGEIDLMTFLNPNGGPVRLSFRVIDFGVLGLAADLWLLRR